MTSLVFPEGSTALAKKYLSQNILDYLEHKKTGSGFTLKKAIASGIKNPDSEIGLYAGDAQSYYLFAPLFTPIIQAYHNGSSHESITQNLTFSEFPDLDPEKKYIVSSRIRVARNLEGFSFPCHITLDQRRKVEEKIIMALTSFENDLKGAYISFEHLTPDKRNKLQSSGLLFKKGDRFQDAAGINTDFPKCRGVFHTPDKNILIWVNEEDHLRIISMDRGSDFSKTFNRLASVLKRLNQVLDFAWDKNLGYLSSCPTNIGTAMRAGVHIRLKKLGQKKEMLTNLVKKHNLQIRGTGGEKTKVKDAVFDISNRQRLGISETDILKTLHTGILAIIQAEKGLH